MIEKIRAGAAVRDQTARAAPAGVGTGDLRADSDSGSDLGLGHTRVSLIGHSRDLAVGIGRRYKRRFIALCSSEQILSTILRVA